MYMLLGESFAISIALLLHCAMTYPSHVSVPDIKF